MIWLIDIDGTLADCRQRLEEAGPEPVIGKDVKTYAEFREWLERVQDTQKLLSDPVVPGMQHLVESLVEGFTAKKKIIYLTAREEEHRDVTERWLRSNLFPAGPIIMRKNRCEKNTSTFKEEVIRVLKNLYPDSPIYTLDDDQNNRCESMYRELGVVHLKPTHCKVY